MLNDLLITVRESKLKSFLQSLSAQTIADMWIRHCEEGNYLLDSPFNLVDLISSIKLHPEYFGINLIKEDDWNTIDINDIINEKYGEIPE